MYELAPKGFTPLLPAYLRLAKAHWPEAFSDDEADGETLGAGVFEALYGDEKTSKLLLRDHEIQAFGRVHSSVRQYLSDFRFPLFVLGEGARLEAVCNARYWATDEGNRDLLMGWYDEGLRLRPSPVFIEERVVAALLPSTSSPSSAKGRDVLLGRLRAHMSKAPSREGTKPELLNRFAADLALSGRQKDAIWAEAAREFPTYSRAGRHPRKSPH